MREICTSGSAGGPGGVIPWGYPTLPDEPGYESGKLRLKQIDHMSNEAWHEFMLSKIA
ncbi:MAG: hypothetical protein QF878_11170 [SAR202 cluster bacterium]|nr:hypothetical protein [SAR202 cluster bacterium]